MARYSMFGMAGIGIAAAIGFVFALTSLGSTSGTPEFGGPDVFKNQTTDVQPATFAATATQVMKKFASADELASFLLNFEANRGQLSATFRESGTSSGGFTLGLSDPDFNHGIRESVPSPAQSQGQA